jgi:hypothetical protein
MNGGLQVSQFFLERESVEKISEHFGHLIRLVFINRIINN